MEVTRDNLLSLIRNGLKREDLSISALEKLASVPKDTVRDFLRAKTHILRADKLEKIRRILEPECKVTISGTVGADTQIIASKDTKDKVDCPPGLEPVDVVAVRIKSDAMAPVFLNGWVVYYTEQRNLNVPGIRGGWTVPYNKPAKKTGKKDPDHNLAEFFGKPCIVKLKDGRMMLRTLKPGSTPGKYNLISYNAGDIKDAVITSAAKIIFIKTE